MDRQNGAAETDSALRSLYSLEDASVLAALEGFRGLENIQVEDGRSVPRALQLAREGIEFADALRPPVSEKKSPACYVLHINDGYPRRVFSTGCPGISMYPATITGFRPSSLIRRSSHQAQNSRTARPYETRVFAFPMFAVKNSMNRKEAHSPAAEMIAGKPANPRDRKSVV